mgnify:CR=1 FL=1
MPKRRVILSFPTELHSEPVIYNIGQQFNLVTNIYQAKIAEGKGWVALEIEGRNEDIEAGITWAISKGVRVDTVSD